MAEVVKVLVVLVAMEEVAVIMEVVALANFGKPLFSLLEIVLMVRLGEHNKNIKAAMVVELVACGGGCSDEHADAGSILIVMYLIIIILELLIFYKMCIFL